LQITNKKNPWPKGWGQKTSIMGVINLTPDSFSDGGDVNSSKKVLDQVNNFIMDFFQVCQFFLGKFQDKNSLVE